MEGVDFKKFVQSTKANKIRNNTRAVPKYPTLQGTKKINNQDKNRLSGNKVRHTFVVEPQKKDLSKNKKMSVACRFPEKSKAWLRNAKLVSYARM